MPESGTYDGSVLWIRLDNQPVMGRLVVMQRHQGMASNYDCAVCPCPPNYNALTVAPTNFYFFVNGVVNVIATGSFGDCNGLQTYQNLTGTSDWTSGAPAIATVNNSTNKGRTTGVSGGTAFISAAHTEPRWLFSPIIGCFQQGNNPHNASSPANVLTLSQSPGQFNMSTGDTGHISVSVNPPDMAVTVTFNGTNSPTSNPNSSGAVTLTASGSGSGNINTNVTASPQGNSGVYTVTAKVQGATSSNSTTINIPPQVLIQMMYGEADGAGSNTQLAVGIAARNRFNDTTYFRGDTTYQNTITSSQFNGITTSITTGVSPELSNAVSVWLNQTADFTTPSGKKPSQCFWSPNASEWTTISNALNSKTTSETGISNGTSCYTGAPYGQQIRYLSSVGSSGGVPNFVFQGARSSASDPVVVQVN